MSDERPRLTDRGELLMRLVEERPDLYIREVAEIVNGSQPMPLPPSHASDDVRRKAVLFNDITRTPGVMYLPLSERLDLRDYLWQQGWRRDVRDEDATGWPPMEHTEKRAARDE